MKFRSYLLALGAALVLHPCHGHAQTPASAGTANPAQGTRTSTMGNPSPARRGVLQTFGFTWGMQSSQAPNGRAVYGHPFVTGVAGGSNAARAGLAIGDTLLSINGRDARLMPLFPNREPGTRYVLRVRRSGEERELDYTFPPPDTATRR